MSDGLTSVPDRGVPLLELRGIRAAYDGIEVLHGVDLEVPEGAVVALLGPNGAGKSTTLKRRQRADAPEVRSGPDGRSRRDGCPSRGALPSRRHHDPGGQGDLPEPDGPREPPHGDLLGPQPRAHRVGGLQPVLPTRPAAQPARRHPLGWRAADAGHGARPGLRSRRADARRAVDGPRAAHRRGAVRDRRPDRAHGRLDPRDRAVRGVLSSASRTSPRSWCRARSATSARRPRSNTNCPPPTSVAEAGPGEGPRP